MIQLTTEGKWLMTEGHSRWQ